MSEFPKIDSVDLLSDGAVYIYFADGKLARLNSEELYANAKEEHELGLSDSDATSD